MHRLGHDLGILQPLNFGCDRGGQLKYQEGSMVQWSKLEFCTLPEEPRDKQVYYVPRSHCMSFTASVCSLFHALLDSPEPFKSFLLRKSLDLLSGQEIFQDSLGLCQFW